MVPVSVNGDECVNSNHAPYTAPCCLRRLLSHYKKLEKEITNAMKNDDQQLDDVEDEEAAVADDEEEVGAHVHLSRSPCGMRVREGSGCADASA